MTELLDGAKGGPLATLPVEEIIVVFEASEELLILIQSLLNLDDLINSWLFLRIF